MLAVPCWESPTRRGMLINGENKAQARLRAEVVSMQPCLGQPSACCVDISLPGLSVLLLRPASPAGRAPHSITSEPSKSCTEVILLLFGWMLMFSDWLKGCFKMFYWCCFVVVLFGFFVCFCFGGQGWGVVCLYERKSSSFY